MTPEWKAAVKAGDAGVLRTMLDSGYTSVLSGASAKPRLDIVIRNEINAGRIPGPRYLANGPEITVTGGLGDENELHLPHIDTPTFAWVADGADEVRKICRLLVREGTDLFKLNVSGHAGPPSSRADRAVMTDAEVEHLYREHLDDVERVQRAHGLFVKRLVREAGVQRLWVEGLTGDGALAFEVKARALAAVEREQVPDLRRQLSEVRKLARSPDLTRIAHQVLPEAEGPRSATSPT